MNEIIRGTTPTIEFVFNDISVSDISVAYLEVVQPNKAPIEKPLSDATISTDSNSVSWVLSQSDTLYLTEKVDAMIVCIWKLTGGLRGESVRTIVDVVNTPKNEVI